MEVHEKLREGGEDKMKRKIMAVMICLAVVGMTGNALAQQTGACGWRDD